MVEVWGYSRAQGPIVRRLTRSAARMNRMVAPSLSVKDCACGREYCSWRRASAVSVIASRKTIWRRGPIGEAVVGSILWLKAMAVRKAQSGAS